VDKPALGIPIIIITIFLFMTGYVYFIASGTVQPEASTAPPVTDIQTPAATPVQEPPPGESSGLVQSDMTAEKELKSWTGRFAGSVDNNLMVIYVGDEAKTFLSPAGLTGVNLARGDTVSFDFYRGRSRRLYVCYRGRRRLFRLYRAVGYKVNVAGHEQEDGYNNNWQTQSGFIHISSSLDFQGSIYHY
jgi:hypothetical protein